MDENDILNDLESKSASTVRSQNLSMDVRTRLAWYFDTNERIPKTQSDIDEEFSRIRDDFYPSEREEPYEITPVDVYLARSLPHKPESWLSSDKIVSSAGHHLKLLEHYFRFCQTDNSVDDALFLLDMAKSGYNVPFHRANPMDVIVLLSMPECMPYWGTQKQELGRAYIETFE